VPEFIPALPRLGGYSLAGRLELRLLQAPPSGSPGSQSPTVPSSGREMEIMECELQGCPSVEDGAMLVSLDVKGTSRD
jgi:hypothetical protein